MKTLWSRLKRSPITFPLAAVAAVGLMAISESSYHASVDSLTRLSNLGTVRVNNMLLVRQLLDAENGQRGYLITGRPEYLAPYRKSMAHIGDTLKTLHDFYVNEPDQLRSFTELATLINNKLSEMDTTVQLRAEGREDAWRAVIETDIGREQMEGIRLAAEKLLERQTTLINAGRAEVYETLLLNRLGVSAMTALSVLAFFMYLRQTSTLDKERRRQKDILQAERDLLETQAKTRTQQLIELAHHLQTAREDERSRLARDLHDELGALLTAAKLDVARLKSRLGVISPEAAERMAHLNEALNSGIALKRRIIENLRPSSLSNLGLVAALEILACEFGEASGIPVKYELDTVQLKPSSELTVYRLVQEALTNVAKYAQAQHIVIQLRALGDQVEVQVTDDGVGFDTTAARPSTHGLLGMRYRVEAEGGLMELSSTLGEGTRIRATLPSRAAG